MSRSRRLAIIQQGFARVLGSAVMADRDPADGFKITDRRRRDDETEAPPAPSQPAAAGVQPAAEPPVPPPTRPSRESAVETPPPGLPERSLAGLFMMLASEALIAMGEAPDPATGQRHVELDHAAGVVDLLMLLREKTEGNRSPEETQIIDELLYDLQLRYVKATKRTG
jgi:hypothetical protein